MAAADLTIDLDAIIANWRALDAVSAAHVTTGAVVKADGYGLGAGAVAMALHRAGVDSFFVALAEEGATLRKTLGPEPEIFVFSGHMVGDDKLLREFDLVPLLNSVEQIERQFKALPGKPFGVQLDTGMNRLGLEPDDFTHLRNELMAKGPRLLMSHLASADEAEHPQNVAQLAAFRRLTDGLACRRSLAATGGMLLGSAYHFDLCRPGIGLYGGSPFAAAKPVVRLSLPVIQCRDVLIGETVGYNATWTATRPSRIATLSAGYADGLIRAIGGAAKIWAEDRPCPLVGRVSMDLIGVDVTGLAADPERLDILGPVQGIDRLAAAAGTIGYEILTSLGARYNRVYIGG
ncbi:MAG: alanine racemase [Rhodobacteraceae bacterium]|nr:alanine racemase [Paracoccaceae bacterium]